MNDPQGVTMPPLTRAQQQAKEAVLVRSAPHREAFSCPDIPSVDAHLRLLCERRKVDSLTPAGRTRINEDIQALLDRRGHLSRTAS